VTPAERYLQLGLRLGRHVDGLVDAYYGPPELNHDVEAEPVVAPEVLSADADALLGELDDGWLRDQVRGLRTYAGVLAGERLAYSDEVEGCYGVRPSPPSPDDYTAVHERLDELLPGEAPLADRLEAFRASQLVPRESLIAAFADVVDELRARTRSLIALPEGEDLELDEVTDEPWWAFNYYLGDLRSRVVVNVDVPTAADSLIDLAAHEVYPGHHTEHAVKEQRLVRERGLVEEAIQLVPTPQAVVSEGIAETGRDVALDEEGERTAVAILRRHGLPYDERSRAVREQTTRLRRVGLDAALMIHEDGASTDDAAAHLQRWGLMTAERARHTVQFVTDPTWRTYVITYSAGGDLCRAYVNGDPSRFERLLTEHVRVGELARIPRPGV
jgi:hypothetical protein